MVRLPPEFVAAAAPFVCVRVTDLRGVDLAFYDFDFDLTFAALTLHPDGTIYHTFAGRDHRGADRHLGMPALVEMLTASLVEHREHVPRTTAETHVPRRPEDSPTFRRWQAEGRKLDCVHCHTIGDLRTADARADGSFRLAQVFEWPDPAQIGLEIRDGSQRSVARVEADSAAAAAGVEPGSTLVSLGDRRLLTFGDLARALREIPETGGERPLHWIDATGAEHRATMVLRSGWKDADPRVFAWRPSKWPLSPKPGFGGPSLDAQEKLALGLAADRSAFRVQYLVTWGENAHTGQNALRAGIREGDVVLSVDGVEFDGPDHFHAWFRLRKKAGEVAQVRVLREGTERTIPLPVVD